MWRRASPTVELRGSANSTDEPRRLLLRSPFIRPTKIFRLTSSSCSSLRRNSGSSRGAVAAAVMKGPPSSDPVRDQEEAVHQARRDAEHDRPGHERGEEDPP